MYSAIKLLFFGLFICAFLLSELVLPKSENACTTADGRQGECVSLLKCTPLYRAFEQQPLPTSVIAFLRKSACGFADNIPLVCCRDDIDISNINQNRPRPPTTSVPKGPSVVAGNANELPAYPNCGNDASDRIIGGTITDIDEFPWMVMMGYTKSNGDRTFECGGVLINKRYVLTAAHCVVGAIKTKFGPLSVVRVGEYDTNSATDCDEEGFCAPSPQNIEVEQVIANPGFTDAKVNREDDIALVRLARDVQFSRFVKPICLPTEASNLSPGDITVVSGWGRTLTDKKSNVKLKLDVPIFDKSQCAKKYAIFKAVLTDKQLCAGGKYAQDSCYGDSGGPLMRRNGPKWETIAVVSFGNGCGGDGWPGVYTDVYKYLPWIRQNLSQ